MEVLIELIWAPIVKRWRRWRSGLVLSPLERELVEILNDMHTETTRTLHVEMLGDDYDLELVRDALRRLQHHGLAESRRDWYYGIERDRNGGDPRSVQYEDDWWRLTASGRDAAGFV